MLDVRASTGSSPTAKGRELDLVPRQEQSKFLDERNRDLLALPYAVGEEESFAEGVHRSQSRNCGNVRMLYTVCPPFSEATANDKVLRPEDCSK